MYSPRPRKAYDTWLDFKTACPPSIRSKARWRTRSCSKSTSGWQSPVHWCETKMQSPILATENSKFLPRARVFGKKKSEAAVLQFKVGLKHSWNVSQASLSQAEILLEALLKATLGAIGRISFPWTFQRRVHTWDICLNRVHPEPEQTSAIKNGGSTSPSW